jgi:hypothetical protein
LPVLGAGYAAVGYRDTAQTYVEGLALFPAVAYQAIAGVVGHEELDGGSSYLTNRWCLGVDHHPVTDWSGAGGGQAAYVLDFNDAEAAGPVWLQVRVIAELGNIDAGALGCLKHCHPLICCNFLAIDG